ncbi:MAG TPA: aminotransferase class III-fold pyridoxal phosphate-dependent enzyme, partial [Polyangiaceae bacterium]|nr:aminotransferase class III-fold pyridoxal phosphate-dependent enzyme [Polyangiaceae bacterium]
ENRYVDLAAGFGALLLGHSHPSVLRAIQLQSERLLQALGDVYPSDAKIGLIERLGQLLPIPEAQVILGQSGADAVSAALKTAALATAKPGVIAFQGSYHGLSYGPLAVTDLRPSYRAPFQEQLSPHVRFALYPSSAAELDESLEMVRALLAGQPTGAILVEPLLGRGGVIDPPAGFLRGLQELARDAGALLITDEIWTGLGRAGDWLASTADGVVPDLVCLGKGLGGGLPISACVGSRAVMAHWSREQEVVHTSTFAGAPLAAATALATLDTLGRGGVLERAADLGARWKARLELRLRGTAISAVRGRGMMLGLDAGELPGGGWALQKALLARGFVTSTGGGQRDVLVLTPPLVITERQLEAFDDALLDALG